MCLYVSIYVLIICTCMYVYISICVCVCVYILIGMDDWLFSTISSSDLIKCSLLIPDRTLQGQRLEVSSLNH